MTPVPPSRPPSWQEQALTGERRQPSPSKESWPIRVLGPATIVRPDGSRITCEAWYDIVIHPDGDTWVESAEKHDLDPAEIDRRAAF